MACPSPEELLELAGSLDKEAACLDSKISKAIESAANQVGKSWSGSWLGYHSRIYYQNFEPVPPGARFSVEWGTAERVSNDTIGAWAEYTFDGVVEYIYEQAGGPDIDTFRRLPGIE